MRFVNAYCCKNLILCSRASLCLKKMGSLSFIQHLNPISNKMEWKIVENDYDYNQEIATSCYGDMLHDDERNKKFGEALKKGIKKLHRMGKEAHVLDIGTGTGLLSMLAVRYGADSVVACESFLPMANCAERIVAENNVSDKIKIVKCHSTSLTVGENGDLKQKANILVSEVFDTELIGEGAIKTFNHAFEHLLEEDSIVIPSSATVYAQIVESDLALKWNKLQDWKNGTESLINIPKEIKNCPGAGAVHDIQLSEFAQEHFKVLSEVLPVFRFDWAKNKKIPTFRQNKFAIKSVSSGKAQVVFMWWDLMMDEDGEIVISCAPVWEQPNVKGETFKEDIRKLTRTLPWRDHWMQAVYFFTDEIPLRENESFTLVSSHDDFSFWFEIENSSRKALETLRPVCNCAFHFLLSRTRIGAMNDDRRRESYFEALKTMINSETTCIVLSDVSLLGVLCGQLGAKKIYVLCESPSVEKVCTMLFVKNEVADVVRMCSSVSQIFRDVIKESGDVLIVSEPYFRNYILPWDNLAIWYLKEEIVNNFKTVNETRSIRTFPKKCKLKCCAVQFDNLWKIATPLNTCEGFSLKIFDDLIASARDKAENYVQAQPLWEYPGIALTKASTVFDLDLNENIPKTLIKRNGKLIFESSGRCDGVALWMEYWLTEDRMLSFGPVKKLVTGEYISWDMFERQGVHLFRKQVEVVSGDSIFYEARFDPADADFNFRFHFGIETNNHTTD